MTTRVDNMSMTDTCLWECHSPKIHAFLPAIPVRVSRKWNDSKGKESTDEASAPETTELAKPASSYLSWIPF